MKKKIIMLMIIVGLLCGGGYGIGNYFVNYALSPVSDSANRNVEDTEVRLDETENRIEKNKKIENEEGLAYEKTTKVMEIKSHDGLSLQSHYTRNEKSHLWSIVVHGYKSSYHNMMSYGKRYADAGYNVLLVSNRAHDQSEGNYIGMGWLDKDDIACWVDWIVKEDPQARILLHGVSMGGATVMMTSGDSLDHVEGYIEDCGYTSVWDIFESELKKRFSLPSFPVLNLANTVAKMKAGYDFKEASSLQQIKKCNKPMMFIHGGKDDFVPTEMVYTLYKEAQCQKELYVVDEAGHAQSKDYDPQAYWNKVFDFIHSYIFN